MKPVIVMITNVSISSDNVYMAYMLAILYCLQPAGERGGSQVSLCITGSCSHPRARNWVQCSKCKEWHHCCCVGIANYIARKDDFEYICYICQ